MSTLTGNKISLTYKSLFKTADNDVLTAALKQMSDGLGNNSGVYLNTGGDLKSTGTLEFANFKGTSTAVTINKLVNEADGISNNDNDTSLPTSAAVKDYVDTHVTSQDLDFSDGTTQSAVDLDSQVFAIVGTTNEIETTASGQQLQIGLPNSVTISGTYTGATFSGDLNGTINTATTATTQSAGDNSTKVATTAYVDTLDAASDLDFSGTTGTGDVNLNTQTFAVTGTTNQITTAASNQGLQISLLSTGVTMPNNSVATTQSAGDNSTKLATTAYVDVLDAASDLDIAGDSGTGDVNLNTQTFTLSGTTNQVTTAVSGQTATFSLPSTIHRNLQGNVTGDLTGNADTATKWQTARNLSVSGEATGTISNVDGSSAVSGAVTLTNSAVIGKVLTGLPTPAAGNIQASDSILEAFGKLQSQVSSISSGLIFKGSWDADTNTPTLISGGGEVESGTTDGATTAFKLIDSSQNFNTTVSIGNKVINQVDGTTALVTVIDSNTQLTLDTNIMLTGEAYTIDASPFIPQGNYYVVNYAGNTNLNGTTDWSIGDWVIADADNRWSKLDHSQVDGQGSPGHLPVFATATTIGDSIVSQVGTALTITGSATTTLGLSSTGNFAVNTNKFTANATTGNVAFPGDLAINTNKFTVNATSGNTLVAGTLDVTSTGIFNDNLSIIKGSAVNLRVTDGTQNIYVGSSGSTRFGLSSGSSIIQSTGAAFGVGTQDGHSLVLGSNNTTALTIDTSQNATFAGDVNVQDNLYLQDGSTTRAKIQLNASDTDDLDIKAVSLGSNMKFFTVDTERMRIDSSGKVGVANTNPSAFNSLGATAQIVIGDSSSVSNLTMYSSSTGYGSLSFADSNSSNSSSQYSGLIQYYHSDNSMQFYTAATERMRIDSSGQVLIDIAGTNSSDLAAGGLAYRNNSGSYLQLSSGVNTDAAFMYFYRKDAAGTGVESTGTISNNGLGLVLNGGGQSNQLVLDSSGNATFAGSVGIGGAPDNILTLTGTAGDTHQRFKEASTTIGFIGGANGIISGHNGKLALRAESGLVLSSQGNAADVVISSGNSTFAGNVGIGTTSPAQSLDTTGKIRVRDGGNTTIPSIQMGTSGIDGLSLPATNTIAFITNSTERMRIDSSGNVGIGTTSPTRRFQVSGSIATNVTENVCRIEGGTWINSGGITIESTGASSAGDRVTTIYSIDNQDQASPLAFGTGTTERMKIDTSGNVGIGTTSPGTYKLNVVGTALFSGGVEMAGGGAIYQGQKLYLDGGGDTFLESPSSNLMTFTTGGTERMRIDSSGNVGFNATSNLNLSNFQISTGSGLGENVSVFIANTSGTPYVNSGTTTQLGLGFLSGIANYVATGQTLGNLQFYGQANDAGYGGASIKALVTTGGNVNRSSHAVDMVFSTMAAGVVGNEERMRITSGGTTEFKKNVDILTDQNTNILKVRSTTGSFTSSVLLVDCDRTSTNNTYNLAAFTNAGTAKCVITDGGDLKNTNNSYGALSDERLKENITDATSKLDDLMKVKVRNFNMIGDEQKQIGVVAQELEDVFPSMIINAKTPDSEDETLYKSVKYSVFVPMLIKSIQELKAKVDKLEQECKCK